MQRLAPKYVLILAAGKGTRMGSATQHKVCFPVDGRPVINRAIEIYRASGIRNPIIVVGALAEQVMQTVSREHQGVVYAFQAEQLGTGHATRVGMQALDALAGDTDADLLLVAGDRIVDPRALQDLYALYFNERCDLAFISTKRAPDSEQGRVVTDASGQVLGIVEMRDAWQRQVYQALRQELVDGYLPTQEQALALIEAHLNPAKAQITFGDLWQRLHADNELTRDEWLQYLQDMPASFEFKRPHAPAICLLPMAIEAVQQVNVSVYLVKASALRYALAHLSTENAQHEEYLSDIINILVREGHQIRNLVVEDSHRVLGYNNPAELLAIENYFRSRNAVTAKPAEGALFFRPLSAWKQAFSDWNPNNPGECANALCQELVHTYGDSPSLLDDRRTAYLELLNFAAQYTGSDSALALVRSPGRANILGRHVDHQGGNCNLMAIDREILLAVSARADDVITLHNVDGEMFRECSFSLRELLAELPWDDWTSLVNSPVVAEMVRTARGDWSQYVKAAVLRLQKHFHDRQLRGMDLYVHGNIPVAAGLSSSSALVVATVEAVIVVNNLEVQPSQLVDLCGEGEWFVGTRGGSADHAAIKYGQRGKVSQVTFFPFGVSNTVDFPRDYHLVLADSRVQARKSQEARNIFNQRVACYRIGLALIKQRFPQYAPLLQHLRDVNTRKLGIPLSWLYRIILALPENCSP
ncbi:MAG: GHMP family kinase ATP-binding protein, partial [Anaerolineae bacterium]